MRVAARRKQNIEVRNAREDLIEESRKWWQDLQMQYEDAIIRGLERGYFSPDAVFIVEPTRASPRLLLSLLRARHQQQQKEREIIDTPLNLAEATKAANEAIMELAKLAERATDADTVRKQQYTALKTLNDFILALVKGKETVPLSVFEKTINRWRRVAMRAGFADYADLTTALWVAARRARTNGNVNLKHMAANYSALLPQLTMGGLASPYLPHIAANIHNILWFLTRGSAPTARELLRKEMRTLLREFLLHKARHQEDTEAIQPTSILQLLTQNLYMTHKEAEEFIASLIMLWAASSPGEFIPGVLIYGFRGTGKSEMIENLRKTGIPVVSLSASAFRPDDIFIVAKETVDPNEVANIIVGCATTVAQILGLPEELTNDETTIANTIREHLPGLSDDDVQVLAHYIATDFANFADVARNVATNRDEPSRLAADVQQAQPGEGSRYPYTTNPNNAALLDNIFFRLIDDYRSDVDSDGYKFAANCATVWSYLRYYRAFNGTVKLTYVPLQEIAQYAQRDLILFIDELGYNPRFMEVMLTLMTGGLLGTVRFNKVFVIAASNLPTEDVTRPLIPAAQARFITIMLVTTTSEWALYTTDHVIRQLVTMIDNIKNHIAEGVEMLGSDFLVNVGIAAGAAGITAGADTTHEINLTSLLQDVVTKIESMRRDRKQHRRLIDYALTVFPTVKQLIEQTKETLPETLRILPKEIDKFIDTCNSVSRSIRIETAEEAQAQLSPIYSNLARLYAGLQRAQTARHTTPALQNARLQFTNTILSLSAIAQSATHPQVNTTMREIARRLDEYLLAGAKHEPFSITPSLRALTGFLNIAPLLAFFATEYDPQQNQFRVRDLREPNNIEILRNILVKIAVGLLGSIGEDVANEVIKVFLETPTGESTFMRSAQDIAEALTVFANPEIAARAAETEGVPLGALLNNITNRASIKNIITKHFSSSDASEQFVNKALSANYEQLKEQLYGKRNNADEAFVVLLQMLYHDEFYKEGLVDAVRYVLDTITEKFASDSAPTVESVAAFLNFCLSLQANVTEPSILSAIDSLHNDYITRLFAARIAANVSPVIGAAQPTEGAANIVEYTENLLRVSTAKINQQVNEVFAKIREDAVFNLLNAYVFGNTAQTIFGVRLPNALVIMPENEFEILINKKWYDAISGRAIYPIVDKLRSLFQQVNQITLILLVAMSARQKMVGNTASDIASVDDVASITMFVARATNKNKIRHMQSLLQRHGFRAELLTHPEVVLKLKELVARAGWNDAAFNALVDELKGQEPKEEDLNNAVIERIPSESEITTFVEEVNKIVGRGAPAQPKPEQEESDIEMLRKALVDWIIKLLCEKEG